jgi:hypothetical protein
VRQLARLDHGALDAIRHATGSVREIGDRYGVPEGLVAGSSTSTWRPV